MPSPLIVKDLDVIEQLHLRGAVGVEPFAELTLHRRKEALHDRVVEAVATPAHAAGDSVDIEHRSIVFARIGASPIGVMEQPDFGASPLQGHLERLDCDVSIVDGADGPTHDEPREKIQNCREVELPTAADHHLRRVADPSLVRGFGHELPIQKVRRDRLIVVAHRSDLESLALSSDQALFLHQAGNTLFADSDSVFEEIAVNARAAVVRATAFKRSVDQDPESTIMLRVRRFGAFQRSIETAGRDLKDFTELRNRKLGPLRVDPGENYAWFLAKKAAAFLRNSTFHHGAVLQCEAERLGAATQVGDGTLAVPLLIV